MTAEEYQRYKTLVLQYEAQLKERDKLVIIRNTADTLVVRTNAGDEIELVGAEPLASVRQYVDDKLAEIDANMEALKVSAVDIEAIK